MMYRHPCERADRSEARETGAASTHNLPGQTTEFMIDLMSVGNTGAPLTTAGAKSFKNAGRAWIDPNDPVSIPNNNSPNANLDT